MDDTKIKQIGEQCQQEYKYALDYRSGRIEAWQENEDLYYLRPQPKIAGRSNYLLPLMPKYVDTLLSKIDDAPAIEFIPTEDADKIKAKKCTKAWKYDASPRRGNWHYKDLLGKKMNILYGRTIANYYSFIKGGKYYSSFNIVDVYDFLVDPRVGGVDLDNADYLGVDNIFLDKSYFFKRENREEVFIMDNVKQIFNGLSKDTVHDYDNKYHEKSNRYDAIGLDFRTYNYKSDKFAKLVGWYTTYDGERYYVLFDYATGLVARIKKLSSIFKQINPNNDKPYFPFASWASNADQFEFWTPAPADRLRDNIKIQSVLTNQDIDNRNFQNFGMTGFDKNSIKDLSLLKPRAGGLVPIDVPKGDTIQNKIYQFRYANLGNSQDIYARLEDLNAKESGVTEEAQGGTKASKQATVYMGDMQQIADRMGLKNKFYKAYYEKLGILYANGLKDNYTEKTAINVLGEDGTDMVKLLKDDTMPEFDIDVKGTQADANDKVLSDQKKSTVLAQVLGTGRVNDVEAIKYLLEDAKFSSDEVQKLLDKNAQGSMENIISAKEENQKLILNKKVGPNKTAMPVHIQTHLDYVKNNEITQEVEDRIMKHISSEMPYVIKNVALDIEKKKINLLLNEQPNVNQGQGQPNPEEAPERGANQELGVNGISESGLTGGRSTRGNI